MIKVVGVRFKRAGKVYYFDPDDLPIEKGMNVIVETARGVDIGDLLINNKKIWDDEIDATLL